MGPLQANLPEMRIEPKRHWVAYIVLLLCVPVVFLLATLYMAGTTWFFYHDSYFALRNVGYGLTLHHADCEVVLTGDSSALTGLDPATVTRVTGMSACNVAEGGTVTVVAGSYPLDAYLAQNAAPKYIVFMNTPSLYTPAASWHDYSSYYEGMVYLLRYEPRKIVYHALLHHPSETYHFVSWAAHAAMTGAEDSIVHPHQYDGYEDPALRRQRHKGLFTYYAEPETQCFRNGWDKDLHLTADPKWPDAMRKKYGVHGTRVIVNVAPVADCDDMKDAYEHLLQGMHANPLEVLPIGMFNNQDVHFTPEGAAHISAEVGEQILAEERAKTP
jgi:hypothetical protein